MNRPHPKLNRYVKSFIYSFISTKFVRHIYIEFLPIQRIIVVWNKSFVAVELAVWIDHLLVEKFCYRLLDSFGSVFLHDLFPQPFRL